MRIRILDEIFTKEEHGVIIFDEGKYEAARKKMKERYE